MLSCTKKDLCMFWIDMHILKTTHTHNKREIYTTGIRKNEKKSQRINVSVVTQKITDEV